MSARKRMQLLVSCATLALLAAACASTPRADDARYGSGQDAAEEAAVVAVVDGLFDAMRTRDTAAIRRLMHPELRMFVPGMRNGQPVVSVSGVDQFIASVARGRQTFDERAYDPEVRIDGPLASVWTYYEFVLGDEFSHCGIDAFHLARTAGGWRITSLAYTARSTGCRPR